MSDIVIAAAKRTAIGSFLGQFNGVPTPTLGAAAIALTGRTGGRLAEVADCCLRAPDDRTFRVQEHHVRIYHFLCAYAESELFDE